MFFKANFYFLIKEAHKVVFIFDVALSVFADVENEKKRGKSIEKLVGRVHYSRLFKEPEISFQTFAE